ncbi:MAG TPA: hypothetical protein PLU22_05270 [Polyangiaceae bacterium]|nr:hypothetical protein [Polyangiaceae bacterium]
MLQLGVEGSQDLRHESAARVCLRLGLVRSDDSDLGRIHGQEVSSGKQTGATLASDVGWRRGTAPSAELRPGTCRFADVLQGWLDQLPGLFAGG